MTLATVLDLALECLAISFLSVSFLSVMRLAMAWLTLPGLNNLPIDWVCAVAGGGAGDGGVSLPTCLTEFSPISINL